MIDSIATYLHKLLSLIWASLRLEPTAIADQDLTTPWALPIGIVVVAVISLLIGQVGVLTINHIRGSRLVFTAIAAALRTIVSYVALGTALWLVSLMILDGVPSLTVIVRAVMVSAAPYVFGFLVVLPYTGPGIERALQLWTVLSLWAIVAHELALDSWLALLLIGLSWLITLAADRVFSKPLSRLRDRIWRAVTGRPLLLTSTDILDQFPPFEQAK